MKLLKSLIAISLITTLVLSCSNNQTSGSSMQPAATGNSTDSGVLGTAQKHNYSNSNIDGNTTQDTSNNNNSGQTNNSSNPQ